MSLIERVHYLQLRGKTIKSSEIKMHFMLSWHSSLILLIGHEWQTVILRRRSDEPFILNEVNTIPPKKLSSNN